MRIVISVVLLLVLSGITIAGLSNVQGQTGNDLTANLIELSSAPVDESAFAKAYDVVPINFPEDLGEHPDFQTEWWYYTGNLADEAGNRFGFQLTFFRRALAANSAERTSEWGGNQVYFAHFGLTDAANNRFYAHERWSRGGPDLAGVQSPPYRVWLEDWEAREVSPGVVHLQAQEGAVSLDLMLKLEKPPVLQGDRGFSPKSNEPGNASYYYSFTRQSATGTIKTPDGAATVSGTVWKDHEWSTSALDDDAVGWDWFAFQLDDGREIMFFQVRRADGGAALVDGVLVDEAGETMPLHADSVQLDVLDYWTSPRNQAEYPAQWRFAIPAADIDLTITPLIADQELNLSTVYWEGAVRIEGTQTGYGYVELTGYAGSIKGKM